MAFLFSPKWQHQNSEIRIQSINSDHLALDVLYDLALNDPVDKARLQAIRVIDDSDTLINIARGPSHLIAMGAINRWVEKFGDDLNYIDKLHSSLPRLFLKTAAIQAKNIDIRRRAVELIQNQSDLISVLKTRITREFINIALCNLKMKINCLICTITFGIKTRTFYES